MGLQSIGAPYHAGVDGRAIADAARVTGKPEVLFK
jgi:hypothetical protein